MKRNCLRLLVLTLPLAAPQFAKGAPPSSVITWGMNIGGGNADEPNPVVTKWTGTVSAAGQPLRDAMAVAAGRYHALALRAEGTIVGWGSDYYYGQATGVITTNALPSNGLVRIGGRVLRKATAVAAGESFSLALKEDHTVVGWGDNREGQTAVPADLKDVAAIAAGKYLSLALRADGTVVQWGASSGGVSAPPAGLSNVVAIAAGGGGLARNLALKRDGTVVAWGAGSDYARSTPPGLSNVVAISVGENHSLALKADGTVFGWGINIHGEATGVATPARPWVASGPVVLSGQVLTNVVAIAAGNEYGMTGGGGKYSLALRKDGTVVAWGRSSYGQTEVPAGLTDVVAIAAGQTFCLAITTNAAPFPSKK